MSDTKEEVYADDTTESTGLLLEQRLPWLLVGLVGATAASVFVSRFEAGISDNVSLAFFLPAIVYLSDAVGTQTETIFVRNAARHKANFIRCLLKEAAIGLGLGVIFGGLSWLFAFYWLKDAGVALTVGLAMLINIAIAPIIAIIVPSLLQKEHKDPALGAGPFSTIIQDLISLLIYFTIASIILFN